MNSIPFFHPSETQRQPPNGPHLFDINIIIMFSLDCLLDPTLYTKKLDLDKQLKVKQRHQMKTI